MIIDTLTIVLLSGCPCPCDVLILMMTLSWWCPCPHDVHYLSWWCPYPDMSLSSWCPYPHDVLILMMHVLACIIGTTSLGKAMYVNWNSDGVMLIAPVLSFRISSGSSPSERSWGTSTLHWRPLSSLAIQLCHMSRKAVTCTPILTLLFKVRYRMRFTVVSLYCEYYQLHKSLEPGIQHQ